MAKQSKKGEFKPGEYLVNEAKKAVVYSVVAHGVVFVGTAKCGPHDIFDVERGMAIAKIRATIAQRKYDAELTRQFIEDVKIAQSDVAEYNGGPVSPHYMRAIQTATEELKAQLSHIRDLEIRLIAYTQA